MGEENGRFAWIRNAVNLQDVVIRGDHKVFFIRVVVVFQDLRLEWEDESEWRG